MSPKVQTAEDQQTFSSASDAIMNDLFGAGGGPGMGMSSSSDDNLAAVVAALSVIEKHLVPMTPRQLAAVVWIRHVGPEAYRPLADEFLSLRSLLGGPKALINALETASLIRTFRGHGRQTVTGGGPPRRGAGW